MSEEDFKNCFVNIEIADLDKMRKLNIDRDNSSPFVQHMYKLLLSKYMHLFIGEAMNVCELEGVDFKREFLYTSYSKYRGNDKVLVDDFLHFVIHYIYEYLALYEIRLSLKDICKCIVYGATVGKNRDIWDRNYSKYNFSVIQKYMNSKRELIMAVYFTITKY